MDWRRLETSCSFGCLGHIIAHVVEPCSCLPARRHPATVPQVRGLRRVRHGRPRLHRRGDGSDDDAARKPSFYMARPGVMFVMLDEWALTCFGFGERMISRDI